MKLINLEQRSSKWLQWRRNRICASDANIIMGTCNFKSIQKLYEEKTKCYEQVPNIYMLRGIELEPIALEAFEKESGLIMFPCVVEHENRWMAASFDGMTIEQDSIVEIKCGGKKSHDLALNGVVDPRYYPQLQHQIEVSGLDFVFYYSFDGNKGKILEVKRDQSFIEEMIEKEFEFWQCLQALIPPEGIPKRKKRNHDTVGIVS
ncbi:MAG TPA: YqaJ viral recombinase family protein [Puia sp.]|nr:YqaJ viral recombinase family protein [Puia sp.]